MTRNLFPISMSCHRVVRVTLKPTTISLKGKNRMLSALKEKGQGLIEYAIILSLVALVVIVVIWMFGPALGNTYSTISSSLPSSDFTNREDLEKYSASSRVFFIPLRYNFAAH